MLSSQADFSKLRVALIHYWLVRHRGGERVLEALADMFPQADIYTLVLDRDSLSPVLAKHRITTSFLQHIPGITRHYKRFMPLFPMALEELPLDGYDLVLSHEAGPAKGVVVQGKTTHVCYSHTPMRYIWEMYRQYRAEAPFGVIGRAYYALTAHYLRQWDYASAARVDQFVASSRNCAERIWKTYRRHADVVYPPVDVRSFEVGDRREDFYLVAGQLVSYKRVDLAIQACRKMNRRLVVIGTGDQETQLKSLAGPETTFLGYQPDEIVRDHYRRCRGFIFPGEEDIGLTPIEAQASGAPVIAYGRGGALETVLGRNAFNANESKDTTGVFFENQSADSLCEAITRFEREPEFSAQSIRSHAMQFDISVFRANLTERIWNALDRHSTGASEVEMPISIRS